MFYFTLTTVMFPPSSADKDCLQKWKLEKQRFAAKMHQKAPNNILNVNNFFGG